MFFRVACAAIFNYYCDHEFCSFGWCARLFLIIIIIAKSFFGWCAWLFFNYYHYCEFCCLGGVHGYYLIISITASFVLSGWRARLFLITTPITNFSCFFSGGVHGYF